MSIRKHQVMHILVLGFGLLVPFRARAAVMDFTTLTGIPNPSFVGQNVDFIAEIQLFSPEPTTTIQIDSVTNYKFDWGDGTDTGFLNDFGPFPGGPANPVFAFESERHAYPAPGTYNVTFTGTVNFTVNGGDPELDVEATWEQKVVASPEVPEPGTVLGLLAVGGVGLGLKRKRQS